MLYFKFNTELNVKEFQLLIDKILKVETTYFRPIKYFDEWYYIADNNTSKIYKSDVYQLPMLR